MDVMESAMSVAARCAVFSVLLISAELGIGQPGDSDARAKLVGVWVGYAVEGKGESPDKGPVKVELTITKDTITGIGLKGNERNDLGIGTYTVKLGKAPFELDGDKMTGNPNRKEVWVGIYELNGDTLKWCVARKKRATTFETGGGAFLLILKRQAK